MAFVEPIFSHPLSHYITKSLDDSMNDSLKDEISVIDEYDEYMARLELEEFLASAKEYLDDRWCACDDCLSDKISIHSDDMDDIQLDDDSNSDTSVDIDMDTDIDSNRMTPEEIEAALDNYEGYIYALD